MTQFGKKYFGLPTPKFYRILGASLVGAFGTTSLGSIGAALPNTDDPIMIRTCLILTFVSTVITMVGSFIFNFFGAIEKEQQN